jgi:hypothetical protein
MDTMILCTSQGKKHTYIQNILPLQIVQNKREGKKPVWVGESREGRKGYTLVASMERKKPSYLRPQIR